MRAKVNRDPRARQPMPGTLAPETLATLPEQWHGLVLQAICQSQHPEAFITDQLGRLAQQLRHHFNGSPTVCERLAAEVTILYVFLVLYYDAPVDGSSLVIEALSASTGPERYATIIYDLLMVVQGAWKLTLNDKTLNATRLESQLATIKRLQALTLPLMAQPVDAPPTVPTSETAVSSQPLLRRLYDVFYRFFYTCYNVINDWWLTPPTTPRQFEHAFMSYIAISDTLLDLLSLFDERDSQPAEEASASKSAAHQQLTQWYQSAVRCLDNQPVWFETLPRYRPPRLGTHWFKTALDHRHTFTQAWVNSLAAVKQQLITDLDHLTQRTHCALQSRRAQALLTKQSNIGLIWMAYQHLWDQRQRLSAAAWQYRCQLECHLQTIVSALKGLSASEARLFYQTRLCELDQMLTAVDTVSQQAMTQALVSLTATPDPVCLAIHEYLTGLTTTITATLPTLSWLEHSCYHTRYTEGVLAYEMNQQFQRLGLDGIDYHAIGHCHLLTDELMVTPLDIVRRRLRRDSHKSHPDKHPLLSLIAHEGFKWLHTLTARADVVNQVWRQGQWAQRLPTTVLSLTYQPLNAEEVLDKAYPFPVPFLGIDTPEQALSLSVLALKTAYLNQIIERATHQPHTVRFFLQKTARGYLWSHHYCQLYDGPNDVKERQQSQSQDKTSCALYHEMVANNRLLAHLNRQLAALQQEEAAAKQRGDEEKQRGDEEKQRADEQTQRADEQTQRADEQTQRADEQTQRADQEAQEKQQTINSNLAREKKLQALYQTKLLTLIHREWQGVTLPRPLTSVLVNEHWALFKATFESNESYLELCEDYTELDITIHPDWSALQEAVLSRDPRLEKLEVLSPSASPRSSTLSFFNPISSVLTTVSSSSSTSTTVPPVSYSL